MANAVKGCRGLSTLALNIACCQSLESDSGPFTIALISQQNFAKLLLFRLWYSLACWFLGSDAAQNLDNTQQLGIQFTLYLPSNSKRREEKQATKVQTMICWLTQSKLTIVSGKDDVRTSRHGSFGSGYATSCAARAPGSQAEVTPLISDIAATARREASCRFPEGPLACNCPLFSAFTYH
ncbi:hypothetical protein FIBSPDRAFT_990999 [Athelia psychrophila]|uniref:Uncharacterized protein n=1 Tax=Athelia psychrophila TaxID=1759441 RepID=A0A165ZBI4_9AGAM|nr:hypothetical protein FIBSPDRAFT_990999 [Fibularhizoctonia sp. CBS 109695]